MLTLRRSRPASIYAFDVLQRAGADFLANKRIFAYALRGIPMGVKCDGEGNVYAGCADGVEVWSPGGTLLGVIEVQGAYYSPSIECRQRSEVASGSGRPS